jgi:hypothetical protein
MGRNLVKGNKKMKKLLIIAVVALLAVPAMAVPIPITSGSCPVNLKVMPMATVVAPAKIDVEITTIDGAGMGSSSGLDYGAFQIGTNLASFQLSAVIGNPGLSGGTWGCHLQGHGGWAIGPVADVDTYPGPIVVGTPFNVFVKVTNVNMITVAFVDAFVYDTTLTLTLSVP